MLDDALIQKKKELQAFFFMTVVAAPLIAVAIVGGYGLLIWLYQAFSGLPAG